MTTTIGFILGSAFGDTHWDDLDFKLKEIQTPFGQATLHIATLDTAPARRIVLLYRHGLPHTLLPNQINFRANTWALKHVGVESLVVTSSVGVLVDGLPMNQPVLFGDLLMPDHRLPDGSLCSMFVEPSSSQGHLVLQDGLFSGNLIEQVQSFNLASAQDRLEEVVFAYVAGPRTKTEAENVYWAKMGAQVNSMSVGPEVVLANELEIPCVGLGVGHKPSRASKENPQSAKEIAHSLDMARDVMKKLLSQLMHALHPAPFANVIYRFGHSHDTK